MITNLDELLYEADILTEGGRAWKEIFEAIKKMQEMQK